MAFNNQFFGNALQGLGQGLMAAGSNGGWNNFAPAFSQGLMNAQNMQLERADREERQKLRALQEEQLRMQVEQQRTQNQDAVALRQKYEKLLGQGMMAPNGMSQAQFGGAPQNQMAPGLMQQFSPEQIDLLRTLPPEQGLGIAAERIFAQPKERAGINIGGVLVDPITGQQIADYSDVIRQNAAAGRSQNIINMPGNPTPDDVGRKAFAEANAKGQAKYFDDVASAGAQAQVRLGEIKQLSQLMANTPTGAGQDFVNTLAAWGQRVGVDTSDITNLPAAEAAQSIVSRLAPTMRVSGSGSTSDIEVRMFLQSLPSLTNTPGGNAVIASNLQKLAERSMAEGDIAVRVQSGELQPAEGRKAIQALGPLNLELPKLDATKPGAMMPEGALNSARNRQTGSEIYLYQDEQGGYFWGDAQRNPVQ